MASHVLGRCLSPLHACSGSGHISARCQWHQCLDCARLRTSCQRECLQAVRACLSGLFLARSVSSSTATDVSSGAAPHRARLCGVDVGVEHGTWPQETPVDPTMYNDRSSRPPAGHPTNARRHLWCSATGGPPRAYVPAEFDERAPTRMFLLNKVP